MTTPNEPNTPGNTARPADAPPIEFPDWAPAKPTKQRNIAAIMGLILGILGLVGFPLILPAPLTVIGLAISVTALVLAMKRGRRKLMPIIGTVIGGIGTILLILAIVFVSTNSKAFTNYQDCRNAGNSTDVCYDRFIDDVGWN